MDAKVAVAEATNEGLTVSLSGHVSSNNANEVEGSLTELRSKYPDGVLTIDVQNLAYISSAGLRVIMRLLSKEGDLSIINASLEVYEVFEMTGLSEMMTVRKALRRMSVDGLEVIGEGATAKVYRLDADTIVKVFNRNVGMQLIEREIACSRAAFVSGVNTAIPFDTVRVGDCYGTVYEMLNAQELTSVMAHDKEHLIDHVRRFAREIKRMHTVEVDVTKFTNVKEMILQRFSLIEGRVCNAEEVAKLRQLFELIPDRTTFIHGDCHPSNVMVQNGEYLFVDLAQSGYGHPMFDMMSMCMIFQISTQNEEKRKAMPHTRDFTKQECLMIYDTFVRAYLDTDDEELVAKAKEQIAGYTVARMLLVTVTLPGFFTPERLNVLKQRAIAYVDAGVEPLCF